MISILKNVYNDKLDDAVIKYNNTYHNTIRMKPPDLKTSIYIDCSKKNNETVSKFKVSKLVVLLEHQNIKIYLQKVILEIGLKKFL